MSNDFIENNRDSKQFMHVMHRAYEQVFKGYTDLVYHRDNSIEQILQKIDLSLTWANSRISVEEKLISQKWESIYCETESCSKAGTVTSGWMRISMADYLNYAYKVADDKVDGYVIKFTPFYKMFWDQMSINPHQFKAHRNIDKNESQGRLVPIKTLIQYRIPMKRYFLYLDGNCELVSLEGEVVTV